MAQVSREIARVKAVYRRERAWLSTLGQQELAGMSNELSRILAGRHGMVGRKRDATSVGRFPAK